MWLFLDMNAFFAAAEQQDNPTLRGRPVGVVPMLADHTCCIAASYEAKCYGVKTGTTVEEARRLCPPLQLVVARPYLYRALHREIVQAVERVVPIHEVLSVDEMVVRPWRNERTLADALRLGQQVQDSIRYEVGEWLSCSVGLAPNAFLAKVASDLQKPRGLSVIGPEDIPHKLHGLALTDWPGIARRMAARFHAAGVTTTEQMYALSLSEMAQVFGGVVGERWWRAIRGESVLLPPVRRRQVGHSNVLAPEYRTRQGAWAVACRLLEKAAERLRDEGYLACRLRVSVSSYAGEMWSGRVRFGATRRTYVLLTALRQAWKDEIAHPSHVSVSLEEIVLAGDVTGTLFGAEEDPRGDRLDACTDALNRRFGRGTVTTAAALVAKAYLDHGRIPFGRPKEVR